MLDSHTDLAREAIETSLRLRQSSIARSAAFRGNIDQSRSAIAASRNLLKRLRQRTIDRAAREAEWHRVSAFDADILRKVFRDLVSERGLPECEWRNLARTLVYEFTGSERAETALVDWIIRN
ncbi:hypothetical protein FJW08_27310 [Mesorhizobium sp. B3-2-1]|nr:hypothetical protein FJW08_27310 [Mesorhizobium sp. B3-2-1]